MVLFLNQVTSKLKNITIEQMNNTSMLIIVSAFFLGLNR